MVVHGVFSHQRFLDLLAIARDYPDKEIIIPYDLNSKYPAAYTADKMIALWVSQNIEEVPDNILLEEEFAAKVWEVYQQRLAFVKTK